MKRFVLTVFSIVLFIALFISSFDALVLSPIRTNEHLAHLRAQTLAQTMADALGRTPSNSIVEFESCGMFTCLYNVFYSMPDGFTEMNARMPVLANYNLRVVGALNVETGGDVLSDLNQYLDQTKITGRLSTITDTLTGGIDRVAYSNWRIHNEKDQHASDIYLYLTKDGWWSKYKFDGKPIPKSNIVHIRAWVNPHIEQ